MLAISQPTGTNFAQLFGYLPAHKPSSVVRARDTDALAEALLWHYENRAAPRAMGAAARERSEANFTVAQYRDRPLRGEVKA